MTGQLFPSLLRGTRHSLLVPDWFGGFENGERENEFAGRFSGPVAVWEDDQRLNLEVDMPGVATDDLEVTVHEGKLHIGAERKRGEGERRYWFDQLRYGKFESVLSLPENFDPATISAELAGGVLTVTFAKRPETQPLKIEVKAKT